MDGAERLKGRPVVSKQEVCERKAKPSAPVSSRCAVDNNEVIKGRYTGIVGIT